ncbi:Protein PPLZ12 [Tetrabaena socialis]|uniref:Protein PPLZ12 n=1 Tax=Tetrabaena socialis TaxID=47790 RepID=A0A2J7ZYN9_9CHLO|nr:Protein PPLZ12 [Tetrabaena socialis]|eukprot:PNH05366.1 Protein PPLZ12 [Tetrabaena socialis]
MQVHRQQTVCYRWAAKRVGAGGAWVTDVSIGTTMAVHMATGVLRYNPAPTKISIRRFTRTPAGSTQYATRDRDFQLVQLEPTACTTLIARVTDRWRLARWQTWDRMMAGAPLRFFPWHPQYFDMLKDVGAHGKSHTVFLNHSPAGVADIGSQVRSAFLEAGAAGSVTPSTGTGK